MNVPNIACRLFDNAARVAKCNAPRTVRTGTRHLVGLASPERLEPRAVPAITVPAAAPLAVQSLDGVGNNLAHPEWGSTAEVLLRRSAAAYADGVSMPAGATRPNARLVSNRLAQSPEGGIVNDRDWTAFVYAWGQFLDHDLSLTESATPREAFSITVPAGDPWFDPAGTGTMTISMSRSKWDPASGAGSGMARQQVNEITAFIDGSQIYGVDPARAAALREFSGGRLRTSTGGLLPLNTAGLANANDARRLPDDRLFLAGDVRANENPELLALHTLFVREHNRLAADAAAKNPSWNDEQVFQHARRIVIAELQKVTYDEFLPALLGAPKRGPDGITPWHGYRADVNPGIATEFSTAAFRVGHSMLGEDIEFLANDGTPIRPPLALRDAFFNPAPLSEVGIDGILKYLASSRAQEIDTRVVDDVRNFLFGAPGQGGFDLAALNIQRGRDHGLADYNTVRAAYGLPHVTSFAQITPDPGLQRTLQQVYGTVDAMDLWVGGLAERHLPGSSVGATFTRILVDQFTRLRDGDRYWYQNVLPTDVVRRIQGTTLADIVRRNTGLSNLQPGVFVFQAGISGSVFRDANGDGVRQLVEQGVSAALVTLVDTAGVVLATARTDIRGSYAFRRLDLGAYRVVVAPAVGGGQVVSRAVAVTKGGEIGGLDVALAAPPAPPAPPRPPRPPQPPGADPRPPLTGPRAALFASLAIERPSMIAWSFHPRETAPSVPHRT